jgi:hypothetical protein
MENGRRVSPPAPVEACRARCKAELSALPEDLLKLTKADPEYPVEYSARLAELRSTLSSQKKP